MKSLVQSNRFSSPTNTIFFADRFDSYISRFLTSLDATELTRTHYRRRLKQVALWRTPFGNTPITRQTILEYKKHLKDQKYEASTIGAYLVAVRQFFGWCEINNIHGDVTRGIKGAKRPKGHRRDALTIGQIHQLLDSIDQSTEIGLRDFVIINTMIRVGLRSIEVVRAKISDIRPINSQSVGLWVHGKGRDEADEFVVLTEDCLSPIMNYISKRGPFCRRRF